MKKSKKWTGERLEGHINNGNTIEHLHRYALAQEFAKDRITLDIASGEGYGSFLLSMTAKKVIGVDISVEDINKAKNKYHHATNLEYVHGSILNIPFESNSFDLVVSFETLEHLSEHDQILNEIKRVLSPNGILIISTPNKLYYSDKRNYKNPFHAKELYINEFKHLIGNYFKNIEVLNQKFITGSLLINENKVSQYFEGNFNEIINKKHLEEEYNIIIASDQQLNTTFSSVFLNTFIDTNLEIVNKIQSSYSYRLGNFLLQPFFLLKRLLKPKN